MATWAEFRPTAAHRIDPMVTLWASFWQSRALLRSLPELTDLTELARAVRAGYTT